MAGVVCFALLVPLALARHNAALATFLIAIFAAYAVANVVLWHSPASGARSVAMHARGARHGCAASTHRQRGLPTPWSVRRPSSTPASASCSTARRSGVVAETHCRAAWPARAGAMRSSSSTTTLRAAVDFDCDGVHLGPGDAASTTSQACARRHGRPVDRPVVRHVVEARAANRERRRLPRRRLGVCDSLQGRRRRSDRHRRFAARSRPRAASRLQRSAASTKRMSRTSRVAAWPWRR